MIKEIRYFSISENGAYLCQRCYPEGSQVSISLLQYFNDLITTIGLESQVLTIMCEVKTTTTLKSSVVCHCFISKGKVYGVDVGFARLSREVHSL